MKRGHTNLSFLIGINKTSKMTSHDVVNKIRNITNEGRVGHMGTLDPMATGLMLVGIGSAARLNNYLENDDKSYIATISFGKTTNTFDIEGEIIESRQVPDSIFDKDFVENYLNNIVGKHLQIPPAYCAIKIDGKPAYKLAREGKNVEVNSRKIEIYNAQCIEIGDDYWKVKLDVSKGTYIRSIANDIGKDLGCGAYLSQLQRIAIGDVLLEDCYTLEDFEESFNNQNYKVINAAKCLNFPIVNTDEKMQNRIANGRSLGMVAKWNMFPGSKIAIINDDYLIAIYRADSLIELNCECKFSTPVYIGK